MNLSKVQKWITIILGSIGIATFCLSIGKAALGIGNIEKDVDKVKVDVSQMQTEFKKMSSDITTIKNYIKFTSDLNKFEYENFLLSSNKPFAN